jgi:hypothetical protein
LRRELSPPSGGTPPPATARLPDGEILHLAPLAEEISRRFAGEHPDEVERYGPAWLDWCVHDNRWLLGWAAEDLEIGGGHFVKQVRWLARVLTGRDYPVAHLIRNLEIAADVATERGANRVADKLREGAQVLRKRPG